MVKKKLLIILAFLVCGHFMIATKNVSAMGDFTGYLVNSYYNPQWDFTTRNDCENYTPSTWISSSYTNTSGSPKDAKCFYFRRSNQQGFQFFTGQILAIQISVADNNYSSHFGDPSVGSISGGLIANHNFYNVIGIDSDTTYTGSNYTIYVYIDKNYNGILKIPLGAIIERGSGAVVSNISIYWPSGELLNGIQNNSGEILDLLREMSEDNAGAQMEQDKQEQQEQGQASQDTQEQTESSVDGSTQNLLSVIGNFFNAFTSARPSNCNFNWGLSEYGFGSINMCQTQIPSEFRTIFSILSIIIIIPMVVWLISSIINAFKEFQQ